MMGATVYLQEHAFLRPAVAPAAVSRWPVALLRFLARLAADAFNALAAKHNALA